MKFNDKMKDPWYDPVEPVCVGTAFLDTKQLSRSVGSKFIKAKIWNYYFRKGKEGLLMCEYEVTNKLGEPILQPKDIDEKEDLVGKRLNFNIEIKEVQNLPEDLCTNPFVTYTLNHEPGSVYATDEVAG